nr:MAG TPA: hypothetical protein [Caudoviricetes sp.]
MIFQHSQNLIKRGKLQRYFKKSRNSHEFTHEFTMQLYHLFSIISEKKLFQNNL